MKKYFPFLVTLFVSIFVGVIVSQSLVARQKKKRNTPIKSTILFKQSNLKGLKGKEVIISLVEIDPKAKTPKHYHPAHVFVYVLEGSGVMTYKKNTSRKFRKGQVFYEIPNRTMVAKNTSARRTMKAIVFIIKDKGKPATVRVK